MKALLVRVGIDSKYGGWNSPVDPRTCEFAYGPIPEEEKGKKIRSGYERSYEQFKDACRKFGKELPNSLYDKYAHLDPDFEHLTYGDEKQRGKRVRELEEDDLVVFYASLSPKPWEQKLVYAIIGFYVVKDKKEAREIPEKDWDKNAHTRRQFDSTDIIVSAKLGLSGRLERCIPIGVYYDNAYRVKPELLAEWGNLDVRKGYIQRSGTLPWFRNPEKFYEWFKKQNIRLVARNN